MQATVGYQMTADAVMDQAAEVVTRTVRTTVRAAAMAAAVCGCRSCRPGAWHAIAWATGMLGGDEWEGDQALPDG